MFEESWCQSGIFVKDKGLVDLDILKKVDGTWEIMVDGRVTQKGLTIEDVSRWLIGALYNVSYLCSKK